MEWLFVLGLSTEIAGAVLLAWEIVFATNRMAAMRGGTLTSSPGKREAQRQAAFTVTGLTLIVCGFVLQLVAYAADSGVRLWLGAAVAFGISLAGGYLIATRWVTSWLHQRAEVELAKTDRP